MKRTTNHYLQRQYARCFARRTNILLLFTAGLLAACSDDTYTEEVTEDTYQLEIASVAITTDASGQTSRVAESSDGSVWEASDEFYVQFDGYDDIGTYQVTNADADTIEAATAIYWPSTSDAQTIIAWYAPESDDDDTIDLSDQTDGVAYVIRAEQTATYSSSGVSLQFTNQLAKVRVTLEGNLAGGVSTICLVSYTTCNHSQGIVSGGANEGYISMYKTTYNGETCWEANVMPGHQITTLVLNNEIEKTLPTDFIPVASAINTITMTVEGDYIYDETTDTYTVSSVEGLLLWANASTSYSSTNCTLTADISLEGQTWPRITYYSGTFDGAGHTISGLNFSSSSAYIGFIGSLRTNGVVRNLAITDASITGSNYTGGIVGYMTGGSISGCSFSGTITGSMDVGGIVGELMSGNVTACYSTADITATERYAGGIVGSLNSGTVSACYYSTGTITASNYTGGIAGYSLGTITTCYWSGNVSTGIGYGSSGDTTEVTGDVDWATAAGAMNSYLETTESEWQYTEEGATDTTPLILITAD